MSRVLLLNPPPVRNIRYSREGRCQERESVLGTAKPPLSLAILASLLRSKGHAVALVDANICRLSTRAIVGQTAKAIERPDIIVLATTTPTVQSDMQVARELKEQWSSLLVAIGPHTSGIPRETLEEFPWLDVAVVGEPELPIVELCAQFDRVILSEVQGIASRSGDAILSGAGPSHVLDLDLLPSPAWDLLPLDLYRLPLIDEPYVLVETSRGCPPACDFCVVPLTHGRVFRQRNTESIVNEIEDVYKRHATRYIYLWGDTVTMGHRFLKEFSAEVQRRGLPIRWMANARVDTLPSYDFVQKLKASGCWMLSVGVETGDDHIRKTMSKRFDCDRIRLAFQWLQQAGIISFAFFILGYLGDNQTTMEQTIQLSLQIDPDYAAFYPAVPYPGTAFYRECVSRGWLATRDWSKYDYSTYVISNHVLRPELVLPMKTSAYRKFYLRPRVIWRNLKLIRSPRGLAQAYRWGREFIQARGETQPT
ncbi:MAG: B12-binding domain-containing radical SAM protein [Chloroflexi bacterium]|nr:B12-binding domain-containing radical SAM protein [Chloroflexota bacterium]